MLDWLRREIIALIGVYGAAMTVLGQLSGILPMTPWLAEVLVWWQEAMRLLWHVPLQLAGIPLHPHLVGALSAAAFMTMIGIGARDSAQLGGTPLSPLIAMRWLDDMTFPSLAVFAALCIVFLLGHEPNQSSGGPVTVLGSERLVRYTFTLVVTAGYGAGDFIGHYEFHRRLYRLAALVVTIVAFDFALLWALR